MNIVIIPSHNQSENVDKIINAYNNQTVLPELILFVFDRCSDDSRDVFLRTKSKVPKRCLIKNEGENFSAGMTRDFGLSYVEREFPNYTNVIFTDGDCVPGNKLVELHQDCLVQSSKPAVSCGMRIMMEQDGSESPDERLDKRWSNDYSFTDTNARLLISSRVTLESIFTYSCNLAFNKSAIHLIKKINKFLSNSDRLFNPEFDGSWGGEDNFISDCLFRTGNNILMTSKECYVKHQWHKESDKTNLAKKREIVSRLSDRLKRAIINEELPGNYTLFKRNRNIMIPTRFAHLELNNIKDSVVDDPVLNIINQIEFPFELSKENELIVKHTLSRNIIITNATEDNPPRHISYETIDNVKDFLTHIKVYLKNDSYQIHIPLFLKNNTI